LKEVESTRKAEELKIEEDQKEAKYFSSKRICEECVFA
jgi:hypothetical protein